jgi:hypothetical protein
MLNKLVFDFDDSSEVQNNVIAAIKNMDKYSPKMKDAVWLYLLSLLPDDLRQALLYELTSGNKIKNISSTDWPNAGSIVVNVFDRFHQADKYSNSNVKFRVLNDPHYWREELSQTVAGAEHIIIT